ncbi:cytochrome P450 [Nocardiopsis sp. DSM 44743]|uniref:Cytochrome P450 n=2 Tax=Nocardiopsis lambiniae TaxID=3075539 RepID=A0ABU2M500_9ACTN|nr:cytochrome P450 [Nocardiopsis sp. DSM 44743]MDT0327081.1 cytochrome P450 [Nocardiopsis sp. DSM 44743]
MRAEHGPIIPAELAPGVRGWLVTDYATLISWSRDTTTFSHDARLWRDFNEGRVDPDSPLLPMMAPRANALFVDGVEHQRLRRAITDALGAVTAGHLAAITTRYADRLIDEFCERGQADLLNEYARMIPLLVMNDLFGMDEDQGVRFVTAMRNLWAGVDAERSNAEAERALSEVVDAKHRDPGDDLTSRLIRHRAGLSDEEVIMQLLLIIAAANEPTAALIDSALRAVLADPALRTAGGASVAVLDDLMGRVLWRDPPITNYPVIYPRVDVPLEDGRVIEAGSPILLGFAAANHFFQRENAERMEDSANRAHVAWGAGPHRCPARDEATAIATIATRRILERLPEPTLAIPPEGLRWQLATLFWAPVTLPVRFVPRPPATPASAPGPVPPAFDTAPDTRAPASSGLSSLSNFLVRLLRRS